ncbi:hypothetical protein DFH07DRAFT_768814 [Mycena maculata]|uniref:Uncharacterized protein n=1 Tax=Mycena maculata TaxID=230809 RepID=A0AAD7NQ28_9AGAR|nr:hypothetical protein DFH07DRAFT_768814 [Mycena maculata]
MLVSYLTSIKIPHGISGVDLREWHLAIIGYASLRKANVYSFKLAFGPNPGISATAIDLLSATLFVSWDAVLYTATGVYHTGMLDTVEPGTLQVDKGHGHIIFVLQKNLKLEARVVVLQLL